MCPVRTFDPRAEHNLNCIAEGMSKSRSARDPVRFVSSLYEGQTVLHPVVVSLDGPSANIREPSGQLLGFLGEVPVTKNVVFPGPRSKTGRLAPIL